MTNTAYRRYFSEEIIARSPYSGVTTPTVRYGGDRAGDDLTFDWTCVTQPLTIENVPRHADRDQFILFAGTDLDDFREFGAVVRLSIGPEETEHIITEPKLVYIPKGLTYGPLSFAVVGAPVVWMNFFIAPRLSQEWAGGDHADYLVTPQFAGEIFHTRTTVGDDLLFEQRWPKELMMFLGHRIGPHGANFCLFYYAVSTPYYMTERTHGHEGDMWLVNLGGNPLDVEEFDANVTMWWGDEAQKLVMDSTCVAHVPPGLLHRGLFFEPVRKPFVHLHTYTAKGPDKDVIVDESRDD